MQPARPHSSQSRRQHQEEQCTRYGFLTCDKPVVWLQQHGRHAYRNVRIGDLVPIFLLADCESGCQLACADLLFLSALLVITSCYHLQCYCVRVASETLRAAMLARPHVQ